MKPFTKEGFAIEESARSMENEANLLKIMVDTTVKGIRDKIPSARVNGSGNSRLPGIVNLGFAFRANRLCTSWT